MGRAPCCDKANVKKGPWSPEEDSKLKDYIEKYGTGGNWIALPQKAGLRRCGKSCRLRWLNYLRPNIKHGEFSDEEDRIICTLFANIGSRWSIIAAQLPGRTDNDIKNYWNTKLKKKLMGFVNPLHNIHYNNNNNNNSDINISQRKLPVPFHNSSHETTSSPSSSSSFSLSQPLFPNYSTAYYSTTTSTTTPTSSTRLSEQQHQLSNMITSNPNCSSSTLFSTNLSSFSFQTQDHYNLVGYNSYEYPNLKENSNLNLLMFGSEGSCSTSSEGSCSYQIKQEEIIGSAAAFQDQMIGQRFMLNYGGGYDCNYQNLWGQKSNGGFGEGPLDQYHVLEDLKQLLSSSSTSNSQGNNLIVNGSNNFFNVDENKTQEKVMYF